MTTAPPRPVPRCSYTRRAPRRAAPPPHTHAPCNVACTHRADAPQRCACAAAAALSLPFARRAGWLRRCVFVCRRRCRAPLPAAAPRRRRGGAGAGAESPSQPAAAERAGGGGGDRIQRGVESAATRARRGAARATELPTSRQTLRCSRCAACRRAAARPRLARCRTHAVRAAARAHSWRADAHACVVAPPPCVVTLPHTRNSTTRARTPCWPTAPLRASSWAATATRCPTRAPPRRWRPPGQKATHASEQVRLAQCGTRDDAEKTAVARIIAHSFALSSHRAAACLPCRPFLPLPRLFSAARCEPFFGRGCVV
jgi:hypothetical protein